MSIYVPIEFVSPRVSGLPDGVQTVLDELIAVWTQKRSRNVLRQAYVDMKQGLPKGVNIPEYLKEHLDVVMGWPSKAVTGLADRILWDGVTASGQSEDVYGLREILSENQFDLEVHQATESALTQSLAFWVTTPGHNTDTPVVRAYSAEWASALWDWGKREICAGLAITQSSIGGLPEELRVFLPGEIIQINLADSGQWEVTQRVRTPFDHVPMRQFPFNPSLQRPFGRSRVTRQVMSLTDRGIRAGLRSEVSSEFYMAPFFMLLGADESAFLDGNGNQIPAWDWVMGNVKAISRDEDGNIPEVFQSSQQSMDPYIAQLRELAAEFSGATSIPISSLGIVQDNPSSAEAIYAAKEDLVIAATNANRVFGYNLDRVYRDALMMRDGTDAYATEYLKVGTKWRNPAMPSVVSQSDAMVKQVAAIPWLADTSVALEELGYTDNQIVRLQAEKRRAQAGTVLDKLSSMATPSVQVEAGKVSVDDTSQSAV